MFKIIQNSFILEIIFFCWTFIEVYCHIQIKIHAGLTSRIKIMRPVSEIIGTTAKLQNNDILTVEELMYGMMLPSGNDAAVALGTHFGGIIKNGGQTNPVIVVSE